MAQHIT